MIDPAFTLERKAALVVGAANGIESAIALAFAAPGAFLMIMTGSDLLVDGGYTAA
jgi:NAD(P)-dependent dehydrogenase (short-subunit alcohol dehydrogenase family)